MTLVFVDCDCCVEIPLLLGFVVFFVLWVAEGKESKSKDVCPPAFFLSLWGVATFLSTAFTWSFVNNYDESETSHSLAAAIMTAIALCGSTLVLRLLCRWKGVQNRNRNSVGVLQDFRLC